ncbi:hypothetical protein [Sphingomonas adhaesiva]|uniref:hypothetical protein n=1 Tax=Sphingomonas adhaesiva TaxID=28212 RepID=UPI002FF8CD2C
MAISILPPGARRANPPRLPLHIRAAISAELTMLLDRVDLLIARLDDADDDYDLEEDDHSGDPLEVNGEAPSDDGRSILPTRPLYAVNQAAGPINYTEAQTAYLAAENGLVCAPNGGWRPAA